MHSNELGLQGEQQVIAYLRAQNYTILGTNFAIRDGEVDIIAARGDVVAFVEVKTRQHALVDLAELITPRKQQRIARATHTFLAKHPELAHATHRFDVALVTAMGNSFDVAYLPDAFQID